MKLRSRGAPTLPVAAHLPPTDHSTTHCEEKTEPGGAATLHEKGPLFPVWRALEREPQVRHPPSFGYSASQHRGQARGCSRVKRRSHIQQRHRLTARNSSTYALASSPDTTFSLAEISATAEIPTASWPLAEPDFMATDRPNTTPAAMHTAAVATDSPALTKDLVAKGAINAGMANNKEAIGLVEISAAAEIPAHAGPSAMVEVIMGESAATSSVAAPADALVDSHGTVSSNAENSATAEFTAAAESSAVADDRAFKGSATSSAVALNDASTSNQDAAAYDDAPANSIGEDCSLAEISATAEIPAATAPSAGAKTLAASGPSTSTAAEHAQAAKDQEEPAADFISAAAREEAPTAVTIPAAGRDRDPVLFSDAEPITTTADLVPAATQGEESTAATPPTVCRVAEEAPVEVVCDADEPTISAAPVFSEITAPSAIKKESEDAASMVVTAAENSATKEGPAATSEENHRRSTTDFRNAEQTQSPSDAEFSLQTVTGIRRPSTMRLMAWIGILEAGDN